MTSALFANAWFGNSSTHPTVLNHHRSGERFCGSSNKNSAWQSLCRWLVDGTSIGLKPMQQVTVRSARPAQVPRALAASDHPLLPTNANISASHLSAASALPVLRVVRVHELGQPRSSVGRMVISGRMADVCAELDRLAAQETA